MMEVIYANYPEPRNILPHKHCTCPRWPTFAPSASADWKCPLKENNASPISVSQFTSLDQQLWRCFDPQHSSKWVTGCIILLSVLVLQNIIQFSWGH